MTLNCCIFYQLLEWGLPVQKLTARQQQILGFIEDFIHNEGYPPTRAEIAKALGFKSINAAEDHLKALARKQAIELQAGASRGIRLRKGSDSYDLPIIAKVAAGSPILAVEHIEDHYRLTPGLFKPKADYLLRVSGNSMCDAGILDGDLLAVHKTAQAENGQIVIARIEDEVTVKRFSRRGNVVRLIAENPEYEPIVVDLRRRALAIEGIAVGVIRNKNL